MHPEKPACDRLPGPDAGRSGRRALRAQDLWVYDNALAGGFEDWSWATRNLAATGDVHSAPNAVGWEPDDWDGPLLPPQRRLRLRRLSLPAPLGEGSRRRRAADRPRDPARQQRPRDGRSRLVPPGRGDLLLPMARGGAAVRRPRPHELQLQRAHPSGGDGGRSVRGAGGRHPLRLRSDAARNGRGDGRSGARPAPDLRSRLRRELRDAGSARRRRLHAQPLGRQLARRATTGSSTSTTAPFDWFFFNYAADNDPQALPAGSEADRFMLESRAAGAEVVLTLPTIGRVAGPDRERRWSFSQIPLRSAAPGRVQLLPGAAALVQSGRRQRPLHPGGEPAALRRRRATSSATIRTTRRFRSRRRSSPTGWLSWRAASARRRAAACATSRSTTSRCSGTRPIATSIRQPPTYDEVWNRGLAIAAAVKAQDPAAQILGPDTWGWCDLWTSAADAAGGVSCIDGPGPPGARRPAVRRLVPRPELRPARHHRRPSDRLPGRPLLPAERRGVRRRGLCRDCACSRSASSGIRRYTSSSWIADEVALIPRLRGWIDTHCPGTRLALTEYAWGDDAAPSGALAQAEILAILGREGVDLATRWVVPAAGSKTEEAFRLFLDYDGAGARALGDRVRAVSSDGRRGRRLRDPRPRRRALRAALQQGRCAARRRGQLRCAARWSARRSIASRPRRRWDRPAARPRPAACWRSRSRRAPRPSPAAVWRRT